MKAHEWLQDPTHWTQRALGRDTAGTKLTTHEEIRAAASARTLASTSAPRAQVLCYPHAGWEGDSERHGRSLLAPLKAEISARAGRPLGLVSWNDAPDRTPQEVRALFLRHERKAKP